MDPIIVTAIIQGGAIAILAYHFLIGLPSLLDRLSKDQQAERMFWASEAEKDRTGFAARAAEIAAELHEIATRLNTSDRHG